MTGDRHEEYWAEVSQADARLDAALGDIRERQDCGLLSQLQAAHARVAALEAHLSKVNELRKEYLGGS